MIFGNACFLRALVNGVFILQACMHYDEWVLVFLVLNNHVACGVKGKLNQVRRMMDPDREKVLRIKIIFGNAAFRVHVLRKWFFPACLLHYDRWVFMVSYHFACGVHDESVQSLSLGESKRWFYGVFIFTGWKSRSSTNNTPKRDF